MSSFTTRWCSAAQPRSTRDVARRAPVAVRQSMAPKWAAPPLPGHSSLYSPRLWAGTTPSPASGSCFSPPGLRNSERVVRPPCALPTYLDPSAAEPFLAFNTLVLIPWCLMIIAPRWELTKKLLGPTWFMVPYALIDTVYFVATAVLDAQNGDDVNAKLIFLFTEAITDPAKMLTLFDNAAYAGQDWVHLCTWDMLAGRWIWLDALETGLPVRFALLTAFNSGPPGLLVYLLTRAVLQKPEDKDEQVTKV